MRSGVRCDYRRMRARRRRTRWSDRDRVIDPRRSRRFAQAIYSSPAIARRAAAADARPS